MPLGLGLSAQGVDDLQTVRMLALEGFELVAEDDVVAGLVAVQQSLARFHALVERMLQDAEVWDAAAAGTDVDQVIGRASDRGCTVPP